MSFEVWFEMRKVIDCSLSMCRCDDMLRVLPDFTGDPVPSRLDSCDGVGKGAILRRDVKYDLK